MFRKRPPASPAAPQPAPEEHLTPAEALAPSPAPQSAASEQSPTSAAMSDAGPETAAPEVVPPAIELPPAATGRDQRRLISIHSFPSTSRIRPRVWWTLGGLGLLAAVWAASWFLLPIKQVQVTGNSHLTEAQVKKLAGLSSSHFGWLYYGKGRAQGLLANPWVQSAVVTRKFPDTVMLDITERKPFLKAVQPDGSVDAVAEDGRLLPNAPDIEKLPSVTGWGPNRLPEAVLVARALSRYTVESVAFTPSGLTVQTASGTVWSGDPKSLVKYAGSISMYPNKKINIYPWGVSVQ